ncbi:ABC transporter permease [Roseicitreum antarcticum]|nr:ABC transporter permease [Roseicitreum antarcticum]
MPPEMPPPAHPPVYPSPRARTLGRSFPMLRTVGALMLREMSTRYGASPGGYIWAFLEPLGMIIVLSLAFSLLMNNPSLGTSFILFKATGFLIFTQYMIVGQMVAHAMMFSKPLLLYPGVIWVDAIVARFILNALVTAIVMTIILAGIMVYEDIRSLLNWGMILLAVATASLLGLGIGTLNCYLFQRFPVWAHTWGVLNRPLFLISGVIILYEDMPQLAQDILWYNPLLHITGMMRAGFYPMYRPDYISLVFVMVCALVPLIFGLLLLFRHHKDLLNR